MSKGQVSHEEIRSGVRALRRQIGETLQDLRRHRGMTQQKLAHVTHLSPDAIDRIELGKGEVDLIHIARLAAALGVSLQAVVRSGYRD